MPELKWFIGPILTLLILGGGGLMAWERIKQKISGQCKDLEELKLQVRKPDGSPNFVPVPSCDKTVKEFKEIQRYHSKLLTNIAVKIGAEIPA